MEMDAACFGRDPMHTENPDFRDADIEQSTNGNIDSAAEVGDRTTVHIRTGGRLD